MPQITSFPVARKKPRAGRVRVFYKGRLRKLSPALVPAIARGEARLVTLPKRVTATPIDVTSPDVTVEPVLLIKKAPFGPDKPIKSWRAVAEVLGVSSHTVARHRKARGDKRSPWFPSADAVRDWYALLVAGPAPKKPRPRRARKTEVADTEYTLANLIAGKLG